MNGEKQVRSAKREGIERFIAEIEKCGGPLNGFDELLWYATVDKVTVGDSSTAFTFKDGTVIERVI